MRGEKSELVEAVTFAPFDKALQCTIKTAERLHFFECVEHALLERLPRCGGNILPTRT